ncbi:hypothetical protein [Celeribacter sp.]|uniref:hypothetical protein n=1 Tax=Celeribacter sp. TaxID=1890673 RepID=UPI003A9326A6
MNIAIIIIGFAASLAIAVGFSFLALSAALAVLDEGYAALRSRLETARTGRNTQ